MCKDKNYQMYLDVGDTDFQFYRDILWYYWGNKKLLLLL